MSVREDHQLCLRVLQNISWSLWQHLFIVTIKMCDCQAEHSSLGRVALRRSSFPIQWNFEDFLSAGQEMLMLRSLAGGISGKAGTLGP